MRYQRNLRDTFPAPICENPKKHAKTTSFMQESIDKPAVFKIWF
ncbi:MAG: hypothetical protein WCY21_01485 [Candidatus Cloacimonadaceae bacterium]